MQHQYNIPKVKESKAIKILTTIWMVPILAMIIALWLAFQYYAKIGPTIEISFKSNAGLIANQSQIKFKDVTIGMVTKISLSEDGTGVIIQARMNKEVTPYLNAKAKFWIVHPDVDANGITGMDTLLSGSYLELYGSKSHSEEENQQQFIGLDDPYIDYDAKGRYYQLFASNTNNVNEGSNVYYRMMKVGRVERVTVSPDGKHINFTLFVEDKYTPFINSKSQFYTPSNFAMDFSKAKMDFTIANFSQIVHGGIAIYTPSQTITQYYPIPENHLFPLYKSLTEMKSKHLASNGEEKVYQFNFQDKITNLEIGIPIKFNEFQIGYVNDIESHYDDVTQSIQSTVFGIVHVDVFDNNATKGEAIITQLVKKGLKAQLAQSIPMIGSQFINLIFDNNQTSTIVKNQPYDIFPTLQATTQPDMMAEVNAILIKVKNLPIEKLLNALTLMVDENKQPIQVLIGTLTKTVENLNKLTNAPSFQAMPNEINQSLKELQQTLQTIQNLTQSYNNDSQFSLELSATLKEVSLAAESIERVSRKLEKKPNALLLGDD